MADQISGKEAGATVLGPVDLLVLEFPGNNFKGEILRNLHELVAAGTIRIIDLVMITKNQEGSISALNLQEVGKDISDALVLLRVSINQMITMDDIAGIGEQLETNSSAAILLYENAWALKTKQAMLDANGRLLFFERIPEAVVQEAIAELAALSAQAA